MSKLKLYNQKKKELERLQQELDKLENSSALQKEMEFRQDLEAVVEKHGMTLSDLADFLAKSSAEMGIKVKGTRKQPVLRTFKHPTTGEVIKARRTSNKKLKSWAIELGVSIDSLEV